MPFSQRRRSNGGSGKGESGALMTAKMVEDKRKERKTISSGVTG